MGTARHDAARGEQRPEAAQPGLRLLEGFHDLELEEGRPFRWMQRRGALELGRSQATRYLELEVLSELFDLSQDLTIRSAASTRVETLVHGWQHLSIEVPPDAGRIELEASRIFPRACYPDDPRELAIRLGTSMIHHDAARHRAVCRNQANNVLNMREMLAGCSVLESAPFSLGIDPHGACNIKPPCVYCLWDEDKKAEGELADARFDLSTLEEYGDTYLRASQLVSCCIGEPFMKRDIGALIDRFAADGKVLELSTNGQVLTDSQIEHLVGRPIRLYVSIDAATAGTYARLRNRRFDQVIDNVRRLSQARGGRGGLPWIFLVFMPMRVNCHELDGFIQLAAELEADRLVLRALEAAEHCSIHREREGHVFDYHAERLPLAELVRLAGQAEVLCRRAGLGFANQLDFGGVAETRFAELLEEGRQKAAFGQEVPQLPGLAPADLAPAESVTGPEIGSLAPQRHDPVPAPDPTRAREPRPTLGRELLPICTEPWRSFYILRRGVLPCCYGSAPLAPMHEHRQAWNGETLQAIRASLAAGRLHDYCLRSQSCPVVGRRELGDSLDAGQRRWLAARRLWHRVNRATGGVPHRVVQPVLHLLVPLVRTLLGRG